VPTLPVYPGREHTVSPKELGFRSDFASPGLSIEFPDVVMSFGIATIRSCEPVAWRHGEPCFLGPEPTTFAAGFARTRFDQELSTGRNLRNLRGGHKGLR